MILGVLPEQGGSLRNLDRTGQRGRFLRQYIGAYCREFAEVRYFSYADERAIGPDNFAVNPTDLPRWVRAFTMAPAARRCDLLRVMAATGALPAILSGRPYVTTYGYHYGRELGGLRGRFMAWRARIGVRRATAVIVTTLALGYYIRRIAPNARVYFIPNSVDTELFKPMNMSMASTLRRIVSVGNLTRNKNHRAILEAVEGVENIEVVVIGEGPEREALEAEARDRGVKLELPGTVQNEELPYWLNSAHLFVFPSLSEGQPKALLEAMSCGLCCIGFDVLGVRDVIESQRTGLLVTRDGLRAWILRMLSSEQERSEIGRQARRTIVDHYSADHVMAKEVELLKGLVQGGE